MAGNYRFYNQDEQDVLPYKDNYVETGTESQPLYDESQSAPVEQPQDNFKGYNPKMRDVTNYYQNPVEDYVKPMPDNMTYPAHSLIPKDKLKDPSRPIPYDINPADWKTGDDATDAERNQRKMVRNYTQQLYEEMAKGGDIEQARKEAARRTNLADVGQGLEQMFKSRSVAHGGPGVDSSYWDAQRKGAQLGVDQAEQDRSKKIADYITKKKLGSEAVSEHQQLKDADIKNKMNDPESDISMEYQDAIQTIYPDMFSTQIDPNTGDEYNPVSGMSANDLMAASKMLEGKARLDLNEKLGYAKLAEKGDAGEVSPKTQAEIANINARTATEEARKKNLERPPVVRPGAAARPAAMEKPAKLNRERGLEYNDSMVMSDDAGNYYDMNKNPITDVQNIKEVDPAQKKAMTESQSKALSYWERADRANSAFDGLGASKNYKLPSSGTKQVAIDTYLQSTGATRMIAKKMLSPEDLQFANANMGFLNAVLRQDSGAAIPESEYAKYKPMLPEYGDTDEILSQKKAERESVVKSLGMAAGDRYTEELGKRRTLAPQQQGTQAPSNVTPYAPDVVKALEFVKNPSNRNNPYYEQTMDILRKKGVIK